MFKKFLITLCVLNLAASSALASPTLPIYDDMEYADQAAVNVFWQPAGYNGVALNTEQNHTPGGSKSVKTTGVNDGATAVLDYSGPFTDVTVEYWMYDSGGDAVGGVFSAIAWPSNPVGLVEFAVFPWGGGGMANYTYKAGDDWTRVDSGIARSVGWHKIEFDFSPTGGAIRFDDSLVTTSPTMVSTQTLWLANFWQAGTNSMYYDDVKVIPEPATVVLLGLGTLLVRKRFA